MARIFITGSADGLGQMTARLLIAGGHRVVLHARSGARGEDALRAVQHADDVVVGDVSSIGETLDVARRVNRLGTFDAVIHNVGIGYREPRRIATVDGLPHVFAVNTLAPYLLTALITPPRRLVYLSSSSHENGDSSLTDLEWTARPWAGVQAYADSKLHDVLLAFAVARLRPDAFSNALHPGWVPTLMGGPDAPDDMSLAAVTQAWLAAGDDPAVDVTAQYFFHQRPGRLHPDARTVDIQNALLAACARFSGVVLDSDGSAKPRGTDVA